MDVTLLSTAADVIELAKVHRLTVVVRSSSGKSRGRVAFVDHSYLVLDNAREVVLVPLVEIKSINIAKHAKGDGL